MPRHGTLTANVTTDVVLPSRPGFIGKVVVLNFGAERIWVTTGGNDGSVPEPAANDDNSDPVPPNTSRRFNIKPTGGGVDWLVRLKSTAAVDFSVAESVE